MIADPSELEALLGGKRLALFFFNKDARNLARAHAAGVVPFPYSVDYVLDPTLRYRPRVRSLAERILDPARVVSDVKAIARLVEERAFDAVVLFETGYEEQLQDHLLEFDAPQVSSLEEAAAKCEADFRNYERLDPNAEFNCRQSRYVVQFLTELFSQHELTVINAYNAVVESVLAQQAFVYAFAERHAVLPAIRPGLAEVPVRFVLGEDWACGKTSYLIDRMKEGASGLAGDFWFRLVSPEAIPAFQMQDIFAIKGVVANLVRRLAEGRPGKPVYIKYDGRLEEFVYGFPRDRTYLIKDLHRFFRDCRFVLVHKADSAHMRELTARFMKKYEVGPERIDRVRMLPDGRFEELGRWDG